MTISEIIRKWTPRIAERDGKVGIMVQGKPNKQQAEELRAAKDEIIAELQRRAIEEAAEKAAEKERQAKEVSAIQAGEILIRPTYHDGEYLSGYKVSGQAAKLLEKIGVAKYVSGWGYHVSHSAIQALGTEFTYAEAMEYTRPAREAEAAKKAAQAAERAEKFQQARETGKPVEISRFMAECNDPQEECSTDVVTIWAMPDGTRETTRRHTW